MIFKAAIASQRQPSCPYKPLSFQTLRHPQFLSNFQSQKFKYLFRFWFLVTFGDQLTKIRKYYVIFVYILQGKMGKTEKKRKENHTTKVTKIPKTKRQKYGMNKTLVSGKKNVCLEL